MSSYTYEHTKAAMMAAYPSLFVNEEDVLDHLFFVNGNGYSWCDGTLYGGDISDIAAYAAACRERDVLYYRQQIDAERAAGGSFFANYYEQELKRLASPNYSEEERAREEARRREHLLGDDAFNRKWFESCWKVHPDGTLGRSKPYPLCQYAKLLQLPSDIQPDWLEAAERAIAIAEERWALTQTDRVFLATAKRRAEQLRKRLTP